jgi:hypothetical protein
MIASVVSVAAAEPPKRPECPASGDHHDRKRSADERLHRETERGDGEESREAASQPDPARQQRG